MRKNSISINVFQMIFDEKTVALIVETSKRVKMLNPEQFFLLWSEDKVSVEVGVVMRFLNQHRRFQLVSDQLLFCSFVFRLYFFSQKVSNTSCFSLSFLAVNEEPSGGFGIVNW